MYNIKREENRQSLRVKLSVTVNLLDVRIESSMEGMSKNIGKGGICILSPIEFENGKELSLKINFPDKEIETKGKVIWSKEINDDSFTLYEMGIEFKDMNQNDNELIMKNYIDLEIQN